MKKYRIGVFGAGRGVDIARNFMLLNCDIVALCDFHEKRLREGAENLKIPVALYTDFDAFLQHDMDAVVLANYFHEHAPYAIKCMEKGLHVFCECISNGTMAEGVELVKAYEKSDVVYFMAENYPQMKFNREMKRICDTGTLGKFLYAEGEYNHPGDPKDTGFARTYNYFSKHWRNYVPGTYYITHSLGPIMRATGATPKRVTAFAAYAPNRADVPTASYNGDNAAIITTQNDDGSIFRVVGCAHFGAHHNAYRICGTKGQIENLRGMDGKIMLRYNAWSKPEDKEEINFYEPEWNDKDEELIKASGHGGGDYITARLFLEAIEEKKMPEIPYDIYSAVAMSSVAILGHRSVLEGGKPFDIPDFRREEDCRLYENDRLSPFYGTNGDMPSLPACSDTEYKPTEKQLELYDEMVSKF